MQKTLFHGTPDKDFDPTAVNPRVGQYDLCLADDQAIAEMYAEDRAEGEGGAVFAVTVEWSRLADEEEAEAIICDVYGIDDLGDAFIFEYLDDPSVMDAIVAQGFDGVEFLDQSPGCFESHDTVRIYKSDCVAGWEQI